MKKVIVAMLLLMGSWGLCTVELEGTPLWDDGTEPDFSYDWSTPDFTGWWYLTEKGEHIETESNGIFLMQNTDTYSPGYPNRENIKFMVVVPNLADSEKIKQLYLEFKVWKWEGQHAFSYDIDVEGDGDVVETKVNSGFFQHDGYKTHYYNFTLSPQPQSEKIHFDFRIDGQTTAGLSDIIVQTLCVPEPLTVGFLLFGGLALIGKQKV